MLVKRMKSNPFEAAFSRRWGPVRRQRRAAL
jgi:hypothetical protein